MCTSCILPCDDNATVLLLRSNFVSHYDISKSSSQKGDSGKLFTTTHDSPTNRSRPCPTPDIMGVDEEPPGIGWVPESRPMTQKWFAVPRSENVLHGQETKDGAQLHHRRHRLHVRCTAWGAAEVGFMFRPNPEVVRSAAMAHYSLGIYHTRRRNEFPFDGLSTL